MKRIENHCVNCDIPCLGILCHKNRVPVYYCEYCGNEGAEYIIEGKDYHEECAEKYIEDMFNDLSLSEKAELLDISFHKRDWLDEL